MWAVGCLVTVLCPPITFLLMFISNCSYKGVFLKKTICARIPLLIIAANTVQIDAMTLSTELCKRFVGQVQKIAFVIH